MDELESKEPLMVLSFFDEPLDLLELERPIDVLRRGDLDLVKAAARKMKEQGLKNAGSA